MAGAYKAPSVGVDVLPDVIGQILERLKELERPTGTQTANSLATLQQLVAGLINQTNLSVTGNATIGGDIHASGDIYTPHGRATPVTTGYVSAWLNSDGRLGATASSIDVKQDIEPVDPTPYVEALKRVAMVRFRYIEAVKELGDEAPFHLGSIAQYFVANGLGEWVFDDEDGNPQGINYEHLTIPLIMAFQSLENRLTAAGL